MAEEEGGGQQKGKRWRNWEIDPDQISILEAIGHGSTSCVYSGVLNGNMIAVKEIAEADEATLQAVRRELQVMTRTDHPTLLRFVGLVSLTPPLRLCLEFCRGGTLFDLLHNRWEIPLSWVQRVKILLDTASAVEYLHTFRKEIIHRDLKSLNIFLFGQIENEYDVPEIRLADFGFSRILEGSKEWQTLTRGAGSMHWMAPEVYSTTRYNSKADIFSFGIICYEVICRHMAFEDLDPEAAADRILSGARPDMPPDTPEAPEDLKTLMVCCWQHEPDQRPNAGEVVQALSVIQENIHAQYGAAGS
jgi:serine/threonine protein kinase